MSRATPCLKNEWDDSRDGLKGRDGVSKGHGIRMDGPQFVGRGTNVFGKGPVCSEEHRLTFNKRALLSF